LGQPPSDKPGEKPGLPPPCCMAAALCAVSSPPLSYNYGMRHASAGQQAEFSTLSHRPFTL
jgi:hypothetical protein